MINLKKNFKFKDILMKNFVNLTDEDAELVRGWRNNKKVMSWTYSREIIPKKEHLEFIKNLGSEKINFYWLVMRNNEGCGVVCLNRVDKRNKNAFLGVYKNPFLKKDGLGKLLIKSLKYIAFTRAKLHTLKLEVIATNERARNFYKKSGFLEEGRLRDFVCINRKRIDVIIMGIFNDAN